MHILSTPSVGFGAGPVSFLDRHQRLNQLLLLAREHLLKRTVAPPIVLSIDETISAITTGQCSVSRFGDGEFKLMVGLNTSFQPFVAKLSSRLREIILTEENGLLVCIPDVYGSLEKYIDEPKTYWSRHLLKYRYSWYRLLNRRKAYHNAFITRCYYCFVDKSKCCQWFGNIKDIWRGRDVVLVEGDKSRLGVGNDLFAGVRSLRRILGPAQNAFAKYEEILGEVRRQDHSSLVLLALGPTATVLAADLHREGFQAIDVGHIDIEYEWYLRKATSKMRVPNKFVNEVADGTDVTDIDDEKYKDEIVATLVR